MSKRLYSIMIIFLFGVSVASAQKAAGYMGKRFLAGVTYQYTPAYGTLIARNSLENFSVKDVLLPAPRIGLAFKYVIKEQKSIDFDVTYQKIEVARNFGSPGYTGPITSVVPFKQATTTAITFSIGTSSHVYHVAPVGLYYGTRFIFIALNSEFRDGDPSSVSRTFSDIDFGFGTELGVRRVVADRVALDIGFDFNFYVNGLFGLAGLTGNGPYGSSDDLRMRQRATFVNFFNNIATFKVGAYYLL